MSRAVPDQGCVGDDDLGRDGPVRVRGRGCVQREQCAADSSAQHQALGVSVVAW